MGDIVLGYDSVNDYKVFVQQLVWCAYFQWDFIWKSLLIKVNDPPVRNSQSFMMEMRAARMVQAADSLLKLVSELKQTAIFSGFASLNDHVEQRTTEFNQQAERTDRMLARIGEEAAASLKELESHYYSSAQRTPDTA